MLQTQKRLSSLLQKRVRIEERLTEVNREIMKARENHRAQIAASLKSKIPEEQEMARNIAAWWDVLYPDSMNQ
ncbi:hypothetical protein [Symmachiella dynata]|uniref:hypothetical protein n=1 Tax=Symmachiella dynata TaxID=2527995 RepID=UPI0011A4E32C|nr:hypothetical protein [Symmachiella dynata]